MKWKNQPIAAFDTETTGLDPFSGDRIIEFAAVVFHLDDEGNAAEVTEHSWLVNPQMPIPKKVTQITGLSNADVADAPLFEEIADEVHALLAGSVAVAHNFPFDLGFLSVEFGRVNLNWPRPIAEVDTVDLSIRLFANERGHRLEDLCRRLDITLDNAHRATADARACGECFIELARRHDVDDELQAMLDWANAIGLPPENGPLSLDDEGRIVFLEGPLEGEVATEHPVQLHWMVKARERVGDEWRWRYPESTRQWIQRWLNVRGSGRARGGEKSFRPEDWVVDSCIADRRMTS